MGFHDREYYQRDLDKKAGRVASVSSKAQTKATPKTDDDIGRLLRASRGSEPEAWHPVLVVLLTVCICLVVYGVVKVVSSLSGH